MLLLFLTWGKQVILYFCVALVTCIRYVVEVRLAQRLLNGCLAERCVCVKLAMLTPASANRMRYVRDPASGEVMLLPLLLLVVLVALVVLVVLVLLMLTTLTQADSIR